MRRQFTALTLFLLVPIAIHAKDLFPAGCVDCHAKDHRVSTMLARWNGKADAKTLAAMQAFVPKGITLKGKHPPVAAKDIPASCVKCHNAKAIPPLAPLMHGIHLAKADQGEFMKKFGGDCTHCHKLNRANGTWSLPSGPEK